jgi:hypothetical protein
VRRCGCASSSDWNAVTYVPSGVSVVISDPKSLAFSTHYSKTSPWEENGRELFVCGKKREKEEKRKKEESKEKKKKRKRVSSR